jgi:hypothetical protein
MAGPSVRKAVEYFFAEIPQLPDGIAKHIGEDCQHDTSSDRRPLARMLPRA